MRYVVLVFWGLIVLAIVSCIYCFKSHTRIQCVTQRYFSLAALAGWMDILFYIFMPCSCSFRIFFLLFAFSSLSSRALILRVLHWTGLFLSRFQSELFPIFYSAEPFIKCTVNCNLIAVEHAKARRYSIHDRVACECIYACNFHLSYRVVRSTQWYFLPVISACTACVDFPI